MLFYTYILQSELDGYRYIGFTDNLKRRLEEHGNGRVSSTEGHVPMKLIYCEMCTNENDARRRELYFKTTDGRRFLAKRLKSYYQSQ